MHIAYPFRVDRQGQTARTDHDGHVRDLIEQLLFTSPGERVHRIDFGSGLLRLLFDGASPELAEATRFSVRAGLERYLGQLIELKEVQVDAHDSSLRVSVQYVVRSTGQERSEEFERSA